MRMGVLLRRNENWEENEWLYLRVKEEEEEGKGLLGIISMTCGEKRLLMAAGVGAEPI